jgi:hypothetical protein
MKHRNGKGRVAVFVLPIQRASTECRHVSFFDLVNVATRKLGKQGDVKKFGFFVEPQMRWTCLNSLPRSWRRTTQNSHPY